MAKPRRQSQYAPGPEQVFVEAVFRGIWQLLSWPFRRKSAAKKTRFGVPPAVAAQLGSHWRQVENHLAEPQTYAQAVADADKLLDAALQAAGIIGQTMGDRLKGAATLFPKDLYDAVWQAHKLRNNLAHEVGARVSEPEARRAVATFRQALDHLGIL